MSSILEGLGSRLADKWAATLLGPGLLLVAAAAAAVWGGQGRALDVPWFARRIAAGANTPAAHSPGVLVVGIAAVLAAGAAVGLAAAAIGWIAERAWMAPGWSRPGRALTTWRQRRWTVEDKRLRQAMVNANLDEGFAAQPATRGPKAAPHAIEAAVRRRNAIAPGPPARPTWTADRMRAMELRVRAAYGLEMAVVWPRLWPVIGDPLRADLNAAQDSYGAAARLAGWALLYAILAGWWWPAAIIAVVAACLAWVRARIAVSILADLLEAAVDLHGRDLAAQLGIRCDGPLDHSVGTSITAVLAKDAAGHARLSRGARRVRLLVRLRSRFPRIRNVPARLSWPEH
jgi:hypothetical protein